MSRGGIKENRQTIGVKDNFLNLLLRDIIEGIFELMAGS